MIDNQDLNRLYRYALSLSRDEALAYDLVHGAILKVIGREMETPVSYLRTVIRNLFYDEMRSQAKFTELSESDPVVDMTGDLEKIFIDKEELELALVQMKPLDREILFLWAVEKMTFAEISEELGVKKGTLLSRVSRLRKHFSSKEDGNEKTP